MNMRKMGDFLKAQIRHLEMENKTSNKEKERNMFKKICYWKKIHKNAGTSH